LGEKIAADPEVHCELFTIMMVLRYNWWHTIKPRFLSPTYPTENSIRPRTMLPWANCTGQNLPHRDRRQRKRGTRIPVSAQERGYRDECHVSAWICLSSMCQ